MMRISREKCNRRRFLGAAASAAAMTLGASGATCGEKAAPRRRIILSFYCDDTGPYAAGVKAFQTFLEYCAEEQIAGESSLILGARGRSMSRRPTDEDQAYLEQVRRAWQCGIDAHMELMTHRGLFDFEQDREREGAAHEGLWLHEPDVDAATYERYVGNILAEGERAKAQFTGFTWPGCGCETCKRRYAELRSKGHRDPNPALWQALLSLAKQGKFRGPTIPCFFQASETDFGIRLKARDGAHGVYDLMPNAMDRFGIWENNPARVDADYYLSADGKSGIIARHIANGAPYCLWYAHWQGLNPAKGVGWKAFTTVVQRIRSQLKDRVVWMRPSDITQRYHAAGGWDFVE